MLKSAQNGNVGEIGSAHINPLPATLANIGKHAVKLRKRIGRPAMRTDLHRDLGRIMGLTLLAGLAWWIIGPN